MTPFRHCEEHQRRSNLVHPLRRLRYMGNTHGMVSNDINLA